MKQADVVDRRRWRIPFKKNGHLFVVEFDIARRMQVLRLLTKWAVDPELPFS